MAFTTEEEVRLRFQLTDTVNVPSSLVASCIEEAHEDILRLLDPRHEAGAPPGPLVLGETFLAGAAVLRAVAAKDAYDQKNIAVGGQRIEDGARFGSLMSAAAAAVDQAWAQLEPYLVDRAERLGVAATDSTPVLGEG
jgi:hypothetical protein